MKVSREERRANKRAELAKAVAKYLILWNQWAASYDSEAVAIAEAVVTINRWIKRLPKYKDRGKIGNRVVSYGYDLKDRWLKENAGNLISAEISIRKEHEYFDSEGFHCARAYSDEWVDADDYWQTKLYTLYAYEILVEGQQLYRFHSEKKLATQLPNAYNYNPNSQGRAQPLTNADVERFKAKCLGLIDLERMLAAKLNVNQKDCYFWSSRPLSVQGKFYQPIKELAVAEKVKVKQLPLQLSLEV